MKKLDVILSSALLVAAATGNAGSLAFGQGFGDYLPQTTQPAALSAQPRSAASPQTTQPARSSQALPTAQTVQTPQIAQSAASRPVRQANAAANSTQNVQSAQNPQVAQTSTPTQRTRLSQPSAAASANAAQPVRVAQAPTARPNAAAQLVANAQNAAAQAPTARPNAAAQPVANAQNAAAQAPTARPNAAAQSVANAFVPPPADYKLSENEQLKLDEFLTHWENFGKGIKQVSCNVHMMEFDGGVLQQNSKKPIAHNWGLFRFKAPNQLLYHIKGEFSYANAEDGGDAVWKEGQNELKIVLDGKSLTQYDYANKKAVVYPLAEDERDLDLTMDNGQFPLFFVAKAETLKNRFYLRLVTPSNKRQSEVWIEAFPRYARDAQQFQSIVVILGLKDMQPTYMRKIGVNGKSKTDLKFERVEVNKGRWTIEGTVDDDWTKEVRPERFSLLRQEAVETNYAQTPNGPNVAPVAQTATTPAPVRAATRPNAQNVVR